MKLFWNDVIACGLPGPGATSYLARYQGENDEDIYYTVWSGYSIQSMLLMDFGKRGDAPWRLTHWAKIPEPKEDVKDMVDQIIDGVVAALGER